MTSQKLTRSALVITTTPHIPREYGNRNRVFQTIGFLKSLGYTVSCLLYPFDEEWEFSVPAYYSDLVADFDYFAVIPSSKRLHQGASDYHHQIDEWWDDNIGAHLAWLFQRKRFDLLFVNYTFLSKALEFAPKPTFRILDTHDLFTGRRETFEQFGVKAEFFYTNAEQEAVAFKRADAVIAIKESEGELLRTLTDTPIITIPYWDDRVTELSAERHLRELHFSHERPLRLGFIGAQNSVNVVNIRSFLRKFARYVAFYNAPVEIIVAGNVCRQLHDNYPFLSKLGRIAHLYDFYRGIDAVIAPLEFSTGIKIKVGEALAWRLPVLATQNAFDGFQHFHSTQCEPSVDSVCRSIVRLAFNELSYKQLASASRRAARAAAKAQEKGFAILRDTIRDASRQILFITDRPFWHRGTYVDELTAQTVEYVSNIAPTIVINLSSEQPAHEVSSPKLRYIHLTSVCDVREWLVETASLFKPVGCLTYICTQGADEHLEILAELLIPCWSLCISGSEGGDRPSVFLRDSKRECAFPVSPLRYLPLKWNDNPKIPEVSIVLPDTQTEWETLVVDIIERECAEAAVPVRRIAFPPYAEFSPGFFAKCMVNRSDRIVVIGGQAPAGLFFLQAAKFRRVSALVVGQDFICPEALVCGIPSLSESVRVFVWGVNRGYLAAGTNAGWSLLWSELARRVIETKQPVRAEYAGTLLA